MPKMNFCIRFQLGNLFGSTKRIGSQLGFLVGNAKWKQVELMYLISSWQSARQCYMKQVELEKTLFGDTKWQQIELIFLFSTGQLARHVWDRLPFCSNTKSSNSLVLAPQRVTEGGSGGWTWMTWVLLGRQSKPCFVPGTSLKDKTS